MTIVTINPVTDGDDVGFDLNGVGYYTTSSNGFWYGNNGGSTALTGAVRFPSTGVPQGATITSATLSMPSGSVIGPGPFSAWRGEKVAAPGAFSSGSLPSSRISANPTTADAEITSANYQSVDVTSIVQELVDQASFGGTIALIVYDAGSATGRITSSSGMPLSDFELEIDYTAASGTTYTTSSAGITAASGTGSAAATFESGAGGGPSVKVQHLTPTDFTSSGGTISISAVASLTSAIALNINSRYVGGGPDADASSVRVEDIALGVKLTATDTVTVERESASSFDSRASVAVIECLDTSGANGWIVRDRRSVSLTTADSESFTPSGIVDADKVIPFITGVRHNASGNTFEQLSASATINRSTGEVTVNGRAGSGNAVIEITTVEFTGSNWSVHYGTATDSGDTGTITLSGSVSDWGNAWIIHQFYKSTGSNVAIADVAPTYVPGTGLDEVDWAFDANHDGNAGQTHVAYVLENADMTVTRFSDTDDSAGNVNVDITSAGLTRTDKAIVWVSSSTSGGGTAHARGLRNAQLTSTTNAQHWAHRSGNTMDIRLQVVEFPDTASGGTTYTASSAGISAGSGTGSAAAAFDGSFTAASAGITSASGVGSAAASFAGSFSAASSGVQSSSGMGSASAAFSGAFTAAGGGLRMAAAVGAAAAAFTGAFEVGAGGLTSTAQTGSAQTSFKGAFEASASGLTSTAQTGGAAASFAGAFDAAAGGIKAQAGVGSAGADLTGAFEGSAGGVSGASGTGSASAVFLAEGSVTSRGISASTGTGSAPATLTGAFVAAASGVSAASGLGSAPATFTLEGSVAASGIQASSATGSASASFAGAFTVSSSGLVLASGVGSAPAMFDVGSATYTASAIGIVAGARVGSAGTEFTGAFEVSARGLLVASFVGLRGAVFHGVVPQPTPPFRTHSVAPVRRVVAIPAKPRSIAISRQARSVYVPSEPRAVSIPAEPRAVSIPAKVRAVSIAADPRVIHIEKGCKAMKKWPYKDPDAKLDHEIYWEKWLEGDSISESSWYVPAGLTLEAQSNTETTTKIWLSGGAIGETYQITNRITTATGRVDERTVRLHVAER